MFYLHPECLVLEVKFSKKVFFNKMHKLILIIRLFYLDVGLYRKVLTFHCCHQMAAWFKKILFKTTVSRSYCNICYALVNLTLQKVIHHMTDTWH